MSTNSEMDTDSSRSSESDSVRGVSGRRGVRGRGGGRVGRRSGGRGGRRGSRAAGNHGGRGRAARGRGTGTVQSAETEEERRERVKDLISNLEEGKSKEILCLAVDRQPGLILDIMDRIEPAQPDGFHPLPGASGPSWCSCNQCRDMPTVEKECVAATCKIIAYLNYQT